MTARRRACEALWILLFAEMVVLAVGLRTSGGDRALWTESLALVIFAAALVALRGCSFRPREALLVIVSASALLQLAVIGVRAASSDDANRYVWDAKVQLSGTDPYRYPPAAPQLAPLRDAPLWPQRAGCAPAQLDGGRCSTLNRLDVRTIYPPVAEAAFVVARVVSLGRTDGLLPLQVLAALGVLATAWLIGYRLLARGRPMWLVAVWAWCPMTIVELANDAHIDWLATLLVIGALVVFASGRSVRGGALLGAAIATKLYPAIALPAMLRRRPGPTVAAAIGVVALSYVPHVLAVGTDVIGYLPDYLKEESYTSGRRFLLLRLLIPDTYTSKAAVAVLVAAALVIAWRSRPDVPEDVAVAMVGVTFLVTTPNYGWYAVLLIALAALTGRLEWLPLAFAASANTLGARHFVDGGAYRTWCYAVGFVLVLVLLACRHVVRDESEHDLGDLVPAAVEH